MISEKKEPKDKAERMILNNFKTMQLLQGWLDEDLTPELICRIHSSISESTLDEAKLGKFRSDDEIFLADDDGNIYHKPCPYTEIYNFDLNYFIKFQLEIFDRAVKAFQNYASKKKETLIDKTELFPILNELNSRQKDIALKLINNPLAPFRATIESYANTNNVAWETARKDLDSLLKKSILSKTKEGKSFVFIPAKTFLEQVKATS